jgi:hypothetical protein
MLPEMLDQIVDGYYADSETYKYVREALERYEKVNMIIQKDSLASDGWEMIEAALRRNK